MLRKGRRMGDNSDNEDNLLLDEEDQRFLTEDDDKGISEAEIEDSIIPVPSKSALELIAKQNSDQQPDFKWSQQKYTPNVFPDVKHEFGKVNICHDETEVLTPFEIFVLTTNFDILIEKIVSESIRYAHQNGREFIVETDEMKAFLGMNLVMGYHILPSLRDYWSTEPDMAVPFISKVMPRARFEEIRILTF